MTGEHWPVLTIRQPWCWSVEHAGKSPENRPWYMKHRGPLWLHSGSRSRWDRDGTDNTLVLDAWNGHVRSLPGWPGLPEPDVVLNGKTTLMAFGAVTSLAEVTGCHHADECAGNATTDGLGRRGHLWCTPWAARGQFHIEMEVRFILPEPVLCRGMLRLWRLPDEVEKAVREQLESAGA